MIPADLQYTAEHEWVRSGGDLEEGVVRVGITDHAQDVARQVHERNGWELPDPPGWQPLR